MKKYIGLIIIAICITLFPSSVYAQDYTNQYGVVIAESDYNNLKLLFSDARIETMSQSEYDYFKSVNPDFNTLQKTTNYIKTTFNQITGETTSTQVSKSEYDAAESNNQTRTTFIETAYKLIDLALVRTDTNYSYFSFSAVWKMIPSVRSFDVIGVRFSRMEVVNGTQQGKQVYKLAGTTTYDYVQYNFNGTNINNFDNGFGISMNLLNADLTYLECSIDSSMYMSGFPAGLFTSYQHAIQSLTLAQSKNYTIGAGLGSVFMFNNGIDAYYDGMEGVYDYFSS